MESPESLGAAPPPGKRRVWWHPLLVRLLEWRLQGACEVVPEVNVGQMPLRLDILLLRRLEVDIPDEARRDLAAISRRLNDFTLIEFKSSSDNLSRGDWNRLLGCSHLFVAQSESGLRRADITLIILAPRKTEGFLKELHQGEESLVEEEPGIHRIEGAAFRGFLMETDRVAGLREPLLTLFSREFVRRPREFSELLQHEHSDMLYYVLQQIEQFRRQTPRFEVEHMTENMKQTLEEMEASFLNALPLERRLRGIPAEEVLKRFTAEEVLKRFTAEELVKCLSAEELLKGLSPEERDRLRKLLDEEPKEN